MSSAGATRAERRRRARKGRWGYRVLIGFGALCIVAAAVWQINATLWTDHSQRVGHSLIERFLKNKALSAPLKIPTAAPGTTSLAACNATVDTGGAQGLLVIPKLGVTAPVLDGTEDAQLDVAVGHDTNSVWPGTAGNSVLDAHDVSYFQNIAQLQPGDRVIYESPCTTYVFKVQTHAVVAQGAPVYNTPEPSITLVTCWPTNALWFTPNRYVVSASEISSTPTKGSGHSYLATSPPPTLNVPADLAAQGVSLATYSLPMGTLTVNGTPDPTWANTPDPLLIQGSGVQGYIAAVKALTQNQLSWWQGLAPGIKPPAPLIGADNPKYLSPLEVTLTAAGSTVTGITLSNTVAVSGGNAPGHYVVSVTESVVGNALAITSWTMTPPGQAAPTPTTTPIGTAGSPSATTAVFDAGTSSGWAGTETTDAAAYDTAAINGAAGFTPTGTVTYQLFANGTCAAPATSSQSVTIAAGAVPNSAATAPLAAGTYGYLASYSGDGHYEAIERELRAFHGAAGQPRLAHRCGQRRHQYGLGKDGAAREHRLREGPLQGRHPRRS